MRIGFCYQEKAEGSVCLLRMYGRTRTALVPARIAGKPVTEVAAYCFSAHREGEPEGLFWYEEFPDREDREKSLTFSMPAEADGVPEEEAGSPVLPENWDPEEMKIPLCGLQVEEVYLSDPVRKAGRYCFYNCENLRFLRFPTTLRDVGGGSFNGCHKVEELSVKVFPREKSGLRDILTDLKDTMTVHLSFDGKEGEKARLLLPEFFEEAVENTPARQILTTVHGCGHRYRYCFRDTHYDFEEYDRLFLWVREQEKTEMAAGLVLNRLMFPWQLSPRARAAYEEWLAEHFEETARYFAGKKAEEEFLFLARRKEASREALDCLIRESTSAGWTEMVSRLMDTRRRRFAPERKKFLF